MKHLLVRQFSASARHPTFGVPHTPVYYQPMHELLDYLRALRSCGQSTHPIARQELRQYVNRNEAGALAHCDGAAVRAGRAARKEACAGPKARRMCSSFSLMTRGVAPPAPSAGRDTECVISTSLPPPESILCWHVIGWTQQGAELGSSESPRAV
jgi:hypothetical protein